MVTRRRKKDEARRAAKGRAAQRPDGDSYGRLFEVGREEELRRTLAAKVYEGLPVPDSGVMERITRIVDEVISEREGGWHFGLSSVRLSKVDLSSDDASARLCADCALPGCCYFDIVRLTSADVERLSARLKLSSEEFVARHCTPFAGTRDHRHTHALKKSKPCEFLKEDDKCHVYADRPTVCADFPFVVDPKTGDVIEIRLFPFCNLPFNLVRYEVTRRVLEGST
ncbi:MAG: YkgJ family cysteine cluster protein [Euryarchaeota archaeon]|nr:YkgJ family cysteine cluster protein [Euryarchaeota archaeon]